jgi:hypothetical protein
MNATIETMYRVVEMPAEDEEQVYYSVVDRDGDEVDNFDSLRDAEVDASERNTNAAIEDAIGGLENLLDSLTESRRLSVLRAIQGMIATAEQLVDEEE